jgi:hypothetical protein
MPMDEISMDNTSPRVHGQDSANDNLAGLLTPPTCPHCSRSMRLARIEPRAGRTDAITYDCACGATAERVLTLRG